MHNGAALAVRPLPHKGDSQASSIVSARLVHERIALLPLRCVHRREAGNCSTVACWPSHSWVSSTVSPSGNSSAVPGKRHTATFGSPIAANPRVMEFLNCVLPARLRPSRVGMRRGLDCSHTLKALLIARHASERGQGTLEGGPRAISWMKYRTLWSGVSVAQFCDFTQ